MSIVKIISILMSFILSFFASIGAMFSGMFAKGSEVNTVKVENTALNVNSGESNLENSVSYASSLKNTVQCTYTSSDRNAYRMTNSAISLVQDLSGTKCATLCDTDGNVYFEDTVKTFWTDSLGLRHYFENSVADGRTNTIRLGEYYYDCHVRDMESGFFKVDKNYHVWGDKLYSQFSIYSKNGTSQFSSFGTEITIPLNKIQDSKIFKNTNGEIESVGFIIKDVGVLGFIVPCDGSMGEITLDEIAGKLVLTMTANYDGHTIPAYDTEDWDGVDMSKAPYITFGTRIYTDSADNYAGLEKATYEERNPLTNIVVGENNAECQYAGYDSLRGCYTFTCTGTDFNIYYYNPTLQYSMPVTIYGDDVDRNINIRFYGEIGCLEAGAVLDNEGKLAAIDVEVCKNFCGDGGEPFYSVKDFQYGDSYFPLTVKAQDKTEFTSLHLYSHWGKNSLKQLSSIEFHTSYYHLSTGCTESNCIAPYYAGQRDGWLLPDFRSRSGIMWEGQPQQNSVGILKYMTDGDVQGEFSGSVIDSCGQCYADVTNHFTSEDGTYTYTVRHVEFPSTDENRTFNTLTVEFNEDVTIDNFSDTFSLFDFNGRFVAYNKLGYLNDSNVCTVTTALTNGKSKILTLGTDRPYFSFYAVTDETYEKVIEHFGCNFALLIRDSKIVIDGKEQSIPFAVRYSGTTTDSNGALTLSADSLSFKKGDSIYIDMILLPWGMGDEPTDSNAMSVRNEIPQQISDVLIGEKVEDAIVPTVKAVDNKAEFTVKGGMNMVAVCIDGLTSCEIPEFQINTGNGWETFDNSVHGYDGYSITTNDGAYSISFVFESDGGETMFKLG